MTFDSLSSGSGLSLSVFIDGLNMDDSFLEAVVPG